MFPLKVRNNSLIGMDEWWVIKIYCDCCKRKINDAESRYSIEIKKGNDREIILNDVCDDCFERFNSIIENAEKLRINNNNWNQVFMWNGKENNKNV